MVSIINFLVAASDILSAGIAITAFSLLLYSLTFNLRDRVARVFAALLLFVTIVYFCDAVVSTISGPAVDTWLRLQWIGIAFIPVAYLHFSDALLATTGRPSRWRRRLAIRLLYLVGGAFLLAATLGDLLVNQPAVDSGAAHLRAGPLFPVFILYFIGSLAAAAWNFLRAYRSTQSSTARRRMLYLMTSAAAPALGAFPFLLLSGQAAALHPLIFWSIALLTNLAVTLLLVVMAYAVAYYGVTQPDRVVKSRLFQWLLRGPVVASTVLTVYVLVNRIGLDPRAVPILIVATLLVLQYGINLVRLPIERVLFYGADSGELRRLQILQDRLLTSGDLQQFLESVLTSLCDSLASPAGFIAAFSDDGKLEYEVSLGVEAATRSPHELPPYSALRSTDASQAANNGAHPNGHPAARPEGGLFEWGPYRIMALRGQSQDEPLGLLGWVARPEALTDEEVQILETLSGRAAAALEDRRLQRDVFQAVDRLLPQIEEIQRLRASANASGTQPLAAGDDSLLRSADLPAIIKNALSDYWGGPKLTGSPLLRLRVVEEALRDHNGDAANALRAVLKQAIERIKPDGQRKFTAEWILYNILEMKFLEGRRVREVALRLAVSEADLYRKQRAAVEQLARAIVVMEQEAAERASDYEVAG